MPVVRSLEDVGKLRQWVNWSIANTKPWTEKHIEYVEGIYEFVMGIENFPEYIDVRTSSVEYMDKTITREEAKAHVERHNLGEVWMARQMAKHDTVDWLLGKTEEMPSPPDADRDEFERQYKKYRWDCDSLERAMEYGRIHGKESHWSNDVSLEELMDREIWKKAVLKRKPDCKEIYSLTTILGFSLP